METERCAAMHLGLWLCKPDWLQNAVAALQRGEWKVQSENEDETRYERMVRKVQGEINPMAIAGDVKPFAFDKEGVAVIPIDGQMQKGESKYGGTSSLAVRRALRIAAADPEVRGVMLQITSPGGTVAGTMELGQDIVRINGIKPVAAHIEDLGGSAAYWAASQTAFISANATAEVGSIGIFVVLYDVSEAFKADGIHVNVISSAPYKGDTIPGTPISEASIANIQTRVNDINEFFLAAVQKGRGFRRKQVEDIATGQVWIAQKALENGLIDEVMPFEVAMAKFKTRMKSAKPIKRYNAEAMAALAAALLHGAEKGIDRDPADR